MAKAIGVTLGRVIQVSETGQGYNPVPMPMYRTEAMSLKVGGAGMAPPELPGGLIEVRQTVTIVYELN